MIDAMSYLSNLWCYLAGQGSNLPGNSLFN